MKKGSVSIDLISGAGSTVPDFFGEVMMRLFLFAILGFLSLEVHAMKVGVIEREFSEKCILEREECAYDSLTVSRRQDYRRVGWYFLNLESERWAAMKRQPVFWEYIVLCEEQVKVGYEIYHLSKDGQKKMINPVMRRAGDRCQAMVMSKDFDDGGFVSIRFYGDGLRSNSGVAVDGVIPVVEGIRAKIVIGNYDDARPIRLAGLLVDGKQLKMRLDEGVVFDIDPESKILGDGIHYSAIHGWDELAGEYGRRESNFLDVEGFEPREIVNDDDIRRVVYSISSKLKYEYSELNFGPYPVRSVEDIYKSGVADCKDFSLVLNYELRKIGVDSVSVMTNLGGVSSPSVLLPGHTWLNHVLVWIPSMDIFVDMTAGAGSEFVKESSVAYGRIGFSVPDGQLLIID